MATGQARAKLLAAAVDDALEAGIADLSLRQIAEAIGTSHRMLLYHFGSRDGLLAAVTMAVEESERQRLFDSDESFTNARPLWDHLSDAALWPQERLFFEIYVRALRDRNRSDGFLDHVVDDWLEPIAARLVGAGIPPDVAAAHARLGLAVVRGLLLDLLATHDLEGTTRAFDLYVASVIATLRRRG